MMRRLFYRKAQFCLAVLAFSIVDSFASVGSDVLAMTGGARAKLIWNRYQWCDSAYNPVQARKSKDGENNGPFTQLMVFDTDQGTERYLDSQIGYHEIPRFTRKNGNYVIWSDSANACSWIRDFEGTQPKRKLIDGGDFMQTGNIVPSNERLLPFLTKVVKG